MKTLMVGSGYVETKEPDTIYLDILRFPNVDIVRDIEKGLPFADETFDKIVAHHILEHMKDLVFVMNEFHRVLKNDGELDIEVPYGKNARIDPTHVRFFTKEGFDFFLHNDINSHVAGVIGYYKLNKFEYLPDEKIALGLHFNFTKVSN